MIIPQLNQKVKWAALKSALSYLIFAPCIAVIPVILMFFLQI